MKQPIITAVLVLIALLGGVLAGNNTGKQEGLRLAAMYCIQHGRFGYARQEYACRKIEVMTAQQWAKERNK